MQVFCLLVSFITAVFFGVSTFGLWVFGTQYGLTDGQTFWYALLAFALSLIFWAFTIALAAD